MLMLIVSFATALGLATVHLFAGRLVFLSGRPRSLWLSAAGGLSVAFVFVYLLPALAGKQATVREAATRVGLDFLAHHVFVVALVGMIAFFGLERIARDMLRQSADGGSKPQRSRPVFWAHVASFVVYNLVIGYMLTDQSRSLFGLLLFFSAMGLHFLVMDFSFREHYDDVYHQKGRWLLACAVLTGWCVGQWVALPDTVVSVAMAFVSGGIILNALKEELPEEKQSRFLPFLLGAAVYTAIALTYAR